MDSFELPKEQLHEVIMRTIEIDNISNKIIRNYFGLNLKFDERSRLINANEIFFFNQYFLIGLGASSRASLLIEIIKEINRKKENKLEVLKDFSNKMVEPYKIRDIFAHNIYPKDLKGITRLESSETYWPKLNADHINLYEELITFLRETDISLNK